MVSRVVSVNHVRVRGGRGNRVSMSPSVRQVPEQEVEQEVKYEHEPEVEQEVKHKCAPEVEQEVRQYSSK